MTKRRDKEIDSLLQYLERREKAELKPIVDEGEDMMVFYYAGINTAPEREFNDCDMYCPLAGGTKGRNNFWRSSCRIKQQMPEHEHCYGGCTAEQWLEANRVRREKERITRQMEAVRRELGGRKTVRTDDFGLTEVETRWLRRQFHNAQYKGRPLDIEEAAKRCRVTAENISELWQAYLENTAKMRNAESLCEEAVRLMKEEGLSQLDAADRVGMCHTSISRYRKRKEEGRSGVNYERKTTRTSA